MQGSKQAFGIILVLDCFEFLPVGITGLKGFGILAPYEWIHAVANSVSGSLNVATGFVKWFVTATLDGILGLIIGLALIPIVTRVLVPLARAVGLGKKGEGAEH